VRIDAETATDHGTLLFFIPGITLERFCECRLANAWRAEKIRPVAMPPYPYRHDKIVGHGRF
jgi:hypothetical protein